MHADKLLCPQARKQEAMRAKEEGIARKKQQELERKLAAAAEEARRFAEVNAERERLQELAAARLAKKKGVPAPADSPSSITGPTSE